MLPTSRNIYLIIRKTLILTISLLLLSIFATIIQGFIGNFYIEHILKKLALSETIFYHRVGVITWYISSLTLLSGAISFKIAISDSRDNKSSNSNWTIFGLILILISLDQSTGLHHAINHDFTYRLPIPIEIGEKILAVLKFIAFSGLTLFYITFFRKMNSPHIIPIVLGLFFLLLGGNSVEILGLMVFNIFPYSWINLLVLAFECLVEVSGGTILFVGLLLYQSKISAL